jgi:hypothetical protein
MIRQSSKIYAYCSVQACSFAVTDYFDSEHGVLQPPVLVSTV